MCRRLCSNLGRIYRFRFAADDIIVYAVLYIRCAVWSAEKPVIVRLVFAKEYFIRLVAIKPARAEVFGFDSDHIVLHLVHFAICLCTIPCPTIAEPNSWQHVDRRVFGGSIGNRYLDKNVFDVRFRIFDKHVEIFILVEHSGIHQLKFAHQFTSIAIFVDQLFVRKRRLRILIQILHVGMRRRRIEIVVDLFHVFAMIPFASGKSEKAFFQDRIVPVPQSHGKTNSLVAVRDSGNTVFIPAVRPRPGMIMGKIIPC